jgi:hypothetical protein
VHREEHKVNTNNESSEVEFTSEFVVLITSHFSNSVIESSKHGVNSTETEHVVEVTNNVVRVMESNVKTSVSESNTSDTTHNKQEKEGKSEEHRSIEIDVTTVDGSESREDFDTSRHSNNHSSSGEVSTSQHPYRQRTCGELRQ